jgi:hypothetical protein
MDKFPSVENGLDFILSHLAYPCDSFFPRTITTHKLKNKQVKVYSKNEALHFFEESNFMDCRINAFRDKINYKGTDPYEPNFLFIADLDISNFKSLKSLDLVLKRILNNLKDKLDNGYPTVLWTGNGYHIYQPVEPIVFEDISEFQSFDQPSNRFLKFAERYISNNKSDPLHNPSFRSCLLRIPGSYNSKCLESINKGINDEATKVKIIQKWDGRRPHIIHLTGAYHAYLVDEKIKEKQNLNSLIKKNGNNMNWDNNYHYGKEGKTIRWIEELLDTPIPDFRKYTLWKILCPYLVNIKKLSYEESFNLLEKWLNKCDCCNKLYFNPKYEIKTRLRYVKSYLPISLSKLKIDNTDFFKMLQKMQIL